MRLSIVAVFAFFALLSAVFCPPAEAETVRMLGVGAFKDYYREPDADLQVTDNSVYISAFGSYEIDAPRYFTAVDGRFSYGSNHYSAPTDGKQSGSPQLEGELRLRLGTDAFYLSPGAELRPYVGLGTRLFIDKSKDTVTSLGYYGYDRRIFQFYVPLGLTGKFETGSWIVEPTAEYDQLVWGRVNSRLQNVDAYNVVNNQHRGFGLRGDVMFHPKGVPWEAGPFVRYWQVSESDVYTDPAGDGWVEPFNTRLQVGAEMRLLF